jgi:hypothetical protein
MQDVNMVLHFLANFIRYIPYTEESGGYQQFFVDTGMLILQIIEHKNNDSAYHSR